METQSHKAMKQIFMGFYALSPQEQRAMLEHLNKYFGATPAPLCIIR
jgi:hypothetical protein